MGGCLSVKWEGRSYESAVSTCSEQTSEEEFQNKLMGSLYRLSLWEESLEKTKKAWREYWCKSYFCEKKTGCKKENLRSTAAIYRRANGIYM